MIYDLNTVGLVIEVNNGCGTVVKSLKEDLRPSRYNSALDAVESLVLAHACSGINVCESNYVQGVRTTLDAIDFNFG